MFIGMSEEAPTDKDDISLERQSSSFFWTAANRSPRLNNTPCQPTLYQHTLDQYTTSIQPTHPMYHHNIITPLSTHSLSIPYYPP